MTLALVQTPVDLGYTAAHGHLLTLVPPPPQQLHRPTLSPCLDSRCYRDQQQQQQQNEPTSSYPHHQQQQQCSNGFVSKIPWSCSTAVLGALVSTDDESSIPTPPPAVVSTYPRDCPIHYLPTGPERSSYVTVHSPASGTGSYPPLSSIRRHHHYQKQQSQERDMPDITAFSRMLVHQRRQFSSESENSGCYKINATNNPATSTNQTTICYQCGHVAVTLPLPSTERPLMPYGSLPRDMTASTVCSAGLDSAEDEDEETGFHPRHQRSHSSGTNYHGSLRRITAV